MPRRTRSSIAARNAASVLPEPVGAAISVSRPDLMAGHASSCGGVGARKCAGEPRGDGWMEMLAWESSEARGRDAHAVRVRSRIMTQTRDGSYRSRGIDSVANSRPASARFGIFRGHSCASCAIDRGRRICELTGSTFDSGTWSYRARSDPTSGRVNGDFEQVTPLSMLRLLVAAPCLRVCDARSLRRRPSPLAQIVKCTDPAGNVTYQSGKCPQTAKTEPVDVATPAQNRGGAANAAADRASVIAEAPIRATHGSSRGEWPGATRARASKKRQRRD